jgi:hypothetical protein
MKVGKGFFFEKKKQKTFLSWGMGVETGMDLINQSFFASFLLKKKDTSLIPAR